MAAPRSILPALAAAVLALGGCGEGVDDVPPPSVEPVSPPEAEASERETGPPQLRVPSGDDAVLWVKRGERVSLHDEPGGQVIGRDGAETEFGSPTVYYVDHVQGGWAAVPTAHFENGRLAWVRLDRRRLGSTEIPWSLEVDLSEYEVSLYANDRRVRTFRVSIGAPGSETPTGNFAVTDTFRGDLNPAYGCCAVALTARQAKLPSGWLGGDRIAIHGTDGPLGAAVSHGCVRAADSDVSELVDKVPPGTPVRIRR